LSAAAIARKIPRRFQAREKLKPLRLSATQDVVWRDHVFHVGVGFYDDGRPGEVFTKRRREQGDLGAIVDKYCIAVSYSLQHGVTVADLCKYLTIAPDPEKTDAAGKPLMTPETPLDAVLITVRDLAQNVEVKNINHEAGTA